MYYKTILECKIKHKDLIWWSIMYLKKVFLGVTKLRILEILSRVRSTRAIFSIFHLKKPYFFNKIINFFKLNFKKFSQTTLIIWRILNLEFFFILNYLKLKKLIFFIFIIRISFKSLYWTHAFYNELKNIKLHFCFHWF